MRQVPCYLIVGNGRLARHMQAYLTFLSIPFQHWHRGMSLARLYNSAQTATHILILINDDAIEPFIRAHLLQTTAIRIHCSGSLSTPLAFGAHPLNTFGHDLYEVTEYQATPFVIDNNAPPFNQLLPGFPNLHVHLDPSQKAKYHALCVLAGNMSCLLWQKLISEFQHTFHWPNHVANTYIKRQMQNLLSDPEQALTGPLVRRDHQTIARNHRALNDDPYQTVFDSFVDCYQTTRGE